jgi:regulator of replication initiation timing
MKETAMAQTKDVKEDQAAELKHLRAENERLRRKLENALRDPRISRERRAHKRDNSSLYARN